MRKHGKMDKGKRQKLYREVNVKAGLRQDIKIYIILT
jgi:hypothetical protein